MLSRFFEEALDLLSSGFDNGFVLSPRFNESMLSRFFEEALGLPSSGSNKKSALSARFNESMFSGNGKGPTFSARSNESRLSRFFEKASGLSFRFAERVLSQLQPCRDPQVSRRVFLEQ